MTSRHHDVMTLTNNAVQSLSDFSETGAGFKSFTISCPRITEHTSLRSTGEPTAISHLAFVNWLSGNTGDLLADSALLSPGRTAHRSLAEWDAAAAAAGDKIGCWRELPKRFRRESEIDEPVSVSSPVDVDCSISMSGVFIVLVLCWLDTELSSSESTDDVIPSRLWDNEPLLGSAAHSNKRLR